VQEEQEIPVTDESIEQQQGVEENGQENQES